MAPDLMLAAMAGLGVLLVETAAPQHLLPAAARTTAVDASSYSRAPAPAACCSFLQRCFLCRRELADGRDIYIYRGDRAFCSEECRCRHILVDDEHDDCIWVAAADCSRRRQAVVSRSELAGRG